MKALLLTHFKQSVLMSDLVVVLLIVWLWSLCALIYLLFYLFVCMLIDLFIHGRAVLCITVRNFIIFSASCVIMAA
jgi:hypothetical protein